jgi:peptide/nickel transport system substrate-binding protein
MKSIISYISVFCIVLTFVLRKESTETKETICLDTMKVNITSLDPAFQSAVQYLGLQSFIFNGLLQLDDSLHIKPDIAKSWTIADAKNIYIYFA